MLAAPAGSVPKLKVHLIDCEPGDGVKQRSTKSHEVSRKKTRIFRVCSCDFVDRSIN